MNKTRYLRFIYFLIKAMIIFWHVTFIIELLIGSNLSSVTFEGHDVIIQCRHTDVD